MSQPAAWPPYPDCSVAILCADARALPLPTALVDAIVCDPPYELGFMGRSWDASGVAYDVDMWRGCLRALKPGGYLLAFGGSRTWHRLTCAIEDAGFEIRDSMAWMYGSGFPKSLDVSKAITAPAADDARRWQGWGTALKPGFEPIVVARKPLAGTVAANVLQFGTGALNIDACRIPAGQDYADKCASVVGLASNLNGDAYGEWTGTRTDSTNPAGRWPTNVVMSHPPLLDEHGEVVGDACADGCVAGCPVAELDAQSGIRKNPGPYVQQTREHGEVFALGSFENKHGKVSTHHGDTGGASRFFPTFRYQPKAPADERPRVNGIAHPTVKPLDLIRWLCRLVTQPGGLILDPFAGSGTTLEAALLEGFNVIVTERDADYLPLIQYRIDRARRRLQPGVARLAKAKPAAQADGQADLFADLLGGAA